MHKPAVRHYLRYFVIASDPGYWRKAGKVGDQLCPVCGDAVVDKVIALRCRCRGENICVLEVFQVDEVMGVGDQGDLESGCCRSCEVGGAPEGRLYEFRTVGPDQPGDFPGSQGIPRAHDPN